MNRAQAIGPPSVLSSYNYWQRPDCPSKTPLTRASWRSVAGNTRTACVMTVVVKDSSQFDAIPPPHTSLSTDVKCDDGPL